jgi:hypothetical protein
VLSAPLRTKGSLSINRFRMWQLARLHHSSVFERVPFLCGVPDSKGAVSGGLVVTTVPFWAFAHNRLSQYVLYLDRVDWFVGCDNLGRRFEIIIIMSD